MQDEFDENMNLPEVLGNHNNLHDSQNNFIAQSAKLLSGTNYLHQESELQNWFRQDSNDCGWEPLSDDGIISFVTNGKCEPECVNINNETENIPEIIFQW